MKIYYDKTKTDHREDKLGLKLFYANPYDPLLFVNLLLEVYFTIEASYFAQTYLLSGKDD